MSLSSFASFRAKLEILVALLPLISGFVKQVEDMFPQAGAGAAKLEAVRKMLENAFATVTELGITFDQIWPMLKGAIEAIVAAANSLGLFKKAAPPAPTP